MMKIKTIIYDFDGTLTPYSVPQYEIITKRQVTIPEFMNQVIQKAKQESRPLIQSYLMHYIEVIKKQGIPLTKENFCLGSENIQYNPGTMEFLQKNKQEKIKQLIITAGLEIYVKQTKIAPLVDGIYGSTFCQEKGKEDKILLSMEKETKNKFIRQIVNEQGEGKSIVYIGDGLTDKPAFQEMKKWGGTSIYVYHTKEDKINAEKLKEQKLIDYAFLADFTQGAELERWINSNTKEEV